MQILDLEVNLRTHLNHPESRRECRRRRRRIAMYRRLFSMPPLARIRPTQPPITNATRHASTKPKTKRQPQPSKPQSNPTNPAPAPPSPKATPLLLRLTIYTTATFLTWHIITHYIFTFAPCYGISMLPTFNSWGDWALVSKYYRRGRGLQVGDVVSFVHPVSPGMESVKRVVGLEGDFVLRDTPKMGLEEDGSENFEQKMLQVPPGHCWVVGDNLPHSRDSRLFGPLPLALIKGKVIRRFSPFWNPQKMGNGLCDPEYTDDVH